MWRIYSCPDPHGAGPSINYLQLYVSLKNCSVIWSRHHCQWLYVLLKNISLTWRLIDLTDWLFIVLRPAQEFFTYNYRWRAKFWPMLGSQGLWGGRGLYRVTPAVTRASVFPVSSEGPPHSVASYDTRGDVEDLFNKDPHGLLTWKSHH
jgi:hypothetical protein